MQLPQPYDATKYDPNQGIPQMPVGKHPVVVSASEVRPTKDNTGGLLELTLTIIEGPAKNQTGAYRLNLWNASQQAVEIAHRQMSALCHAIGVFQVNDSQQLHNLPFIVDVGLQKDPEAAAKGYTEVKRIFDKNGNEPGKPANNAAAQPAQQAPAPQPAASTAWGAPPAKAAEAAPAATQTPSWGAPAAQTQAPAATEKPAWAR